MTQQIVGKDFSNFSNLIKIWKKSTRTFTEQLSYEILFHERSNSLLIVFYYQRSSSEFQEHALPTYENNEVYWRFKGFPIRDIALENYFRGGWTKDKYERSYTHGTAKWKLRLMHDMEMRFVVSGVHLITPLSLSLDDLYFRENRCVRVKEDYQTTATASNYGSDRSINPKKINMKSSFIFVKM